MAKARFDLKLDLRNDAARPLYAGVGATDLAVGVVRDYVADVQQRLTEARKDVRARLTGLELEPKALSLQALTLVNARVDALGKDARARRAAVEARVAELQGNTRALPGLVQTAITNNVATLTGTYAELAKRGETLVTRIRKQESTQAATTAVSTTTAKAKTTRTQAAKATTSTAGTAKKTTKTAAKKTTGTAKKSTARPKASAKATGTAAKKAAAATVEAATDAAAKVGD